MYKNYEEILQEVQYQLNKLPFDERDINEKYKVTALLVEPRVDVDETYYNDIDAVIAGDLSQDEFYRRYFGEDPDLEIIEILKFLKEYGY